MQQTKEPEELKGPADIQDGIQTPIYTVAVTSLVYRYFLLFLLTALACYIFLTLLPSTLSEQNYLISGILILWLLALCRYWFFMITMPYRILWLDEESLTFQSLIRRTTLPCDDIVAIKVSSFYQSYLKIVTPRKKSYSILNHVNGLHDMLARIKKLNPEVEIKGC